MPSPARYNESANLYIISVERFRQLVSLPIVYITGLPGSCDFGLATSFERLCQCYPSSFRKNIHCFTRLTGNLESVVKPAGYLLYYCTISNCSARDSVNEILHSATCGCNEI